MQNYKALKSVNKVSAAKVKVVDREAIEASDETYYTKDNVIDGKKVGDIKDIKVMAKSELSHEELRTVSKSYDTGTGAELDDTVIVWDLKGLAKDIESIKKDITSLQSYKADLEQLEKDLKAL